MRELFLVSFSGMQYGIWKDEILSVRDIHALHRIPLSPARIAGIMIDDGRTVTLADLAVSIGYESSREIEQGCILLKEAGDKVIGFVVSGELRTQIVSRQSVFPLPEYIKTPEFDTCAVHDGIPIPVINVAELYSRVLKPAAGLSVESPRIPDDLRQDISGSSRVRIISAGGELFALPAAGIEEKAVKPGPTTRLPGTPQYVKGVTFQDGRLLPVIDLSQRINSQGVAPDSLMLIAGIGNTSFGLLVDGDAGMLSADKVSIKPAPLITQSPWLKHVVVRAGDIIPLINVAMALSPGTSAVDEQPVWQRYAPDSGFPDIFFRHEAAVVEFSLLGERYALPKQEVQDVIPFKPCRALPDAPPIVIGVAEHQGEILPVVDLAMMFGRRSLSTPAWRMMLVNNRDFRALVITETVFGERQLALEIHRSMPIHLPHNLMYGCYPDDQSVRIILNVEAISVHFEKSLIQKFMPALSQQMRMSPTGIVYKFPEEKSGPWEKVGEEPQPSATKTVTVSAATARAEAEQLAAVATESGPIEVEVAAVYSANPRESQATEDKLSDAELLEQQPLTSAEAVSEQTIEPEPAAMGEESTAQEFMTAEKMNVACESSQAVPVFKHQAEVEDAEFVDWEEAETAAPPIAPEPGQFDFVDAAIPEKAIMPEPTMAAAETSEHSGSGKVVPDIESSGEGSKARGAGGTSKQSALDALKASAKLTQAQKVSPYASADNRPAEPTRTTANTSPVTPDRISGEAERVETLPDREGRTNSEWKRRFTYGAIAVVLLAVLLHFTGSPDKSALENPTQGTETAKTGRAMVQPEQAKVEDGLAHQKADIAKVDAVVEHGAKIKAGQEAGAEPRQNLVLSPLGKTQNEPQRPARISRPPLELDVPANMPVDIDVYVAQEGDTLWSISERFTGSPYNYPRIAGENRIADPDLIFPGQKIRLIK